MRVNRDVLYNTKRSNGLMDLALLTLSSTLAFAPAASNCSIFVQHPSYTLCNASCGHCFNAGGREGAVCSAGTQTGYLCPPSPEGEGKGAVLSAFACLDWSFGSKAMRAAEAAFAAEAHDSVYFGVGTFGTHDDEQMGLGACYRLTVDGVDRDIIAQSVNTGCTLHY